MQTDKLKIIDVDSAEEVFDFLTSCRMKPGEDVFLFMKVYFYLPDADL